MTESLRVLSLQPFYGGSHKQFIDGWTSHSRFAWTTLSLPARHWKWRMRHSGLFFAEEISRRLHQGETWDIIFCTDMLNVAELKGLLPNAARHIPIVLYFHENQFAYPNRNNLERDLHFAFSNFVSAVAADYVWFNSKFNFDSMMEGIIKQSKRWPDHIPTQPIESLEQKVQVQPPGIETAAIDLESCQRQRIRRQREGDPIRLVWAARWEHDKNPDGLLNALIELQNRKVEFRLSVMGESFSEIPAVFSLIQDRFRDRIETWGFQESRESYWQVLARGDVFISTANHEFFGISVAEAILAGLFPLLPDRLAYPELIQQAIPRAEAKRYLYDGSAADLANRIEILDRQRDARDWMAETSLAELLRDKLNWSTRAREMDDALTKLARRRTR